MALIKGLLTSKSRTISQKKYKNYETLILLLESPHTVVTIILPKQLLHYQELVSDCLWCQFVLDLRVIHQWVKK